MTDRHIELLQNAILYEYAAAEFDHGSPMEQETPEDAWDQPESGVGPLSVWAYLYQEALCHYATQKAARVVDVGCGNGGHLLYGLKAVLGLSSTARLPVRPVWPAELHLVDIDSDNLRMARQKLPFAISHLHDMNDSPLGTQCDLALLVEVVEHIARPGDALRNTLVSLAPGGLCVVSTPNRAFHISRGWMAPSGPPANDHHRREWTPNEFLGVVLTWAPEGYYIEHVAAPWLPGRATRQTDGGIIPPILNTTVVQEPPIWRVEPEAIAWSPITVVTIRRS